MPTDNSEMVDSTVTCGGQKMTRRTSRVAKPQIRNVKLAQKTQIKPRQMSSTAKCACQKAAQASRVAGTGRGRVRAAAGHQSQRALPTGLRAHDSHSQSAT